MAKNINEFKQFVEFVSNKVQSGNTITVTQFNEVANRAQMQVFERDYQIFLQTKEVSDFLTVFLTPKSIAINTFGVGSLPSDYQHTCALRYQYIPLVGEAKEVEIKEDTSADWGKISMSQLFKGTKRFPKCSYIGSSIRFLPRDMGMAQLDYFRTPAVPIWNFTVVSGDEVYSPTGSVNFEWDDVYTNQVAAVYLAMIGTNLKDSELTQWSEMFKAQTQQPA